MKFSEAVLKGFEQINGRQCVGTLAMNKKGGLPGIGKLPYRCCVMGAAAIGATGNPYGEEQDWRLEFKGAWGIDPAELNNNRDQLYYGKKTEPFPWEHIYGMAVAAGL